MSIEIPLEDFHLMAQATVNGMRRMAKANAKSLREYRESDFVHSLGNLMIRRKMNVSYEDRYPAKGGAVKDEKCDITATPKLVGFEDRHREERLWVEAKFCGLRTIRG